MKRLAAIMLSFACSASAPSLGGTIEIVDAPTPGLPGYCTHTIYYHRLPGDEFRGFSADFQGVVNQAAPQLSTPTADTNALLNFIQPGSVVQDSHFLLSTSDALVIGLDESEAFLRGTFSSLSGLDLPNPAPFAQIVTTDPGAVQASILVDNGRGVDSFNSAILPNLGIPDFDASLRIEESPADGMPGHTTYTLWIECGGAAEGVLIEAEISGPLFKAAGAGETTFVESVPSQDRATDSHFLVGRSTVFGGEFGLLGSETEGLLSGEFAVPSDIFLEQGERVPFPLAQVTTADPANVQFDIAISYCDSVPVEPIRFRGVLLPEPTSLAAAATASIVVVLSTLRTRAGIRGQAPLWVNG